MVAPRLLVAVVPLLCAGCLVQGRCQSHADCRGDESCVRPQGQLLGECLVECNVDTDCWTRRTPGLVCRDHRCGLPAVERIAAHNFCLEVVNPKSSQFGKDLCLVDLQGKVVLLYFAELFLAQCGQQVVALEQQLVDPLRAEGLTDLEVVVVFGYGQTVDWPTWEDRAAGFDEVDFPIMPDTAGVFYVYAALDDDAFLIDKKGRLVRKDSDFNVEEMTDAYKTKIRALHAE